MSDNKLLNENTIRRFMKLANVEGMTDNFVNEMYGSKKPGEREEDLKKEEEETTEETVTEEEEEVNEEVDELFEQEEEEEEPAMDEPAMDEPAMDEPAMDEPMDEPAAGAADMSLTEEEAQLLIDLGKRLAEAMGDEAGEPADEPPADDMGDMEAPADPEPEPEGAEEEDAPGGRYQMEEEIDQDALVQEVLKRVTKRLVAQKLNK